MNAIVKTGFLLLNKPRGMNSFGCIIHLKKILGKKIKIGHAGTLDPFASGLLVVAIGRGATALVSQIMQLEKTYSATAKLGELTNTLDYTGAIIKTSDHVLCQSDIENSLYSFGSSYEQIPPLYSALKYNGQPLCKLVRKKKIDLQEQQAIVLSKKRIVTFHELRLLSFDNFSFTVKACVSHGTYIRSLMNDIAERAGSCATTYALERSAIGQFTLEQAITLDKLSSIEDINHYLLSLDSIKRQNK